MAHHQSDITRKFHVTTGLCSNFHFAPQLIQAGRLATIYSPKNFKTICHINLLGNSFCGATNICVGGFKPAKLHHLNLQLTKDWYISNSLMNLKRECLRDGLDSWTRHSWLDIEDAWLEVWGSDLTNKCTIFLEGNYRISTFPRS